MSATVTYHELPPVNSWAPGSVVPLEAPQVEQYPFSSADSGGLQTSTTPQSADLPVWNGFEDTSHETPATPDSTPSTPTLSCWQHMAYPSASAAPSPNFHLHPTPQSFQTIVNRRMSAPPAMMFAPHSNDLRNKMKRLPLPKFPGIPASTPTAGPEELCLVCGDKASGYHYNALTCEGCKGFFRRSITKKARYICKYGNNCDIDMYMRRKCQFCRLRKCFAIGMRQELVIPEDQCRMKRESKLKMRTSAEQERKSNSPQQVTSTECLSPPVSTLSPEQQELIQRLSHYQQQTDMPSDGELAKLSRFQCPGGIQDCQHLAELTILNIRLTMDFTKLIPGFLKLNPDDQVALLKAGSFEALMLKFCRRYEAKTDSIILGNQSHSWAYNREAYKQAGLGTATDAVFEFCKAMAKIRVDESESSILAAITIFSERPGMLEPKKAEEIQEVYSSALQAYIEQHRPKNKTIFARLLMKLTDLRSLSAEHADALFALKFKTNIFNDLELPFSSNTYRQPPSVGLHLPSSSSGGFGASSNARSGQACGAANYTSRNGYSRAPPTVFPVSTTPGRMQSVDNNVSSNNNINHNQSNIVMNVHSISPPEGVIGPHIPHIPQQYWTNDHNSHHPLPAMTHQSITHQNVAEGATHGFFPPPPLHHVYHQLNKPAKPSAGDRNLPSADNSPENSGYIQRSITFDSRQPVSVSSYLSPPQGSQSNSILLNQAAAFPQSPPVATSSMLPSNCGYSNGQSESRIEPPESHTAAQLGFQNGVTYLCNDPSSPLGFIPSPFGVDHHALASSGDVSNTQTSFTCFGSVNHGVASGVVDSSIGPSNFYTNSGGLSHDILPVSSNI